MWSRSPKRSSAFSVRSSSQRGSRRSLRLLSSAAAAGLCPSDRVCHNYARRSPISSISSWIWVRFMSLKTSPSLASFPGADEENEDGERLDDGRRLGEPVEEGDHQETPGAASRCSSMAK